MNTYHKTLLAASIAFVLPLAALAQQSVSDLGKPTQQMKSTSNAAYNANPVPTTASTAPAPVTPADNQTIHTVVGSPTMTQNGVRLGNGTVIRYDDIAPRDTTGKVSSLENVNASNYQQRARQSQASESTDTSAAGQAYRTSTVSAQRAVRYGAPSSVAGHSLPGAEDDPANEPGSIGFSPSLYFGGTSPYVMVNVVLTGGYGPASIHYATAGGNASSSWYTPVHGTLSWGAGQKGTRTFRVPINVAAIAGAGGSSEVDIELSGARDAVLKGASTGRIVLQPKLVGYKTPVCGAKNGMLCPGMGGILPVNTNPVTTPPSGTTPVNPPRGIVNPCDPNYWKRTSETPPIKCR